MVFIPFKQLPSIGLPFARPRTKGGPSSTGRYDWAVGPSDSETTLPDEREGGWDNGGGNGHGRKHNNNNFTNNGSNNTNNNNGSKNNKSTRRRDNRPGRGAPMSTASTSTAPMLIPVRKAVFSVPSSRPSSQPSQGYHDSGAPSACAPPTPPLSYSSAHSSNHTRSGVPSEMNEIRGTYVSDLEDEDLLPETDSEGGFSESDYQGNGGEREPGPSYLDWGRRHTTDGQTTHGPEGDLTHGQPDTNDRRDWYRTGKQSQSQNQAHDEPQHNTYTHSRSRTRTPPPSTTAPQAMTYGDLFQAAKDGSLVFRVHMPTSVSPLIWTGDVRTSGFSSANWHLALLTPGAYAGAIAAAQEEGSGAHSYHALPPRPRRSNSGFNHSITGTHPGSPSPWQDWTLDRALRQSLIDHITRKGWLRTHDPGDGQVMPPDAFSPWISTSADFDWVIWEVARLLRREETVEVAVIALVPPASSNHTPRRPTGNYRQPPFPGASGELTLDPRPPLQDHRKHGRGSGDSGRMTHTEKDTTDLAIVGAATAREVLFYGRVFAASVQANLVFDAAIFPIARRPQPRPNSQNLPLDPPPHFFRHQPRAGNSGSWLDALVWEPHDDFKTAVHKLYALVHVRRGGGMKW